MRALDTTHITFSAHALVRYIERFIDPEAVCILRARGLDDRAILERLLARHGAQLAVFQAQVRCAASRCYNAGDALSDLPFRLKLGHTRVVIQGGMCITVLPDDRPRTRGRLQQRTPGRLMQVAA
ncbi:MAG: hypothetical protein JO347_10990 [Candidatus Eremiobacteraeota bacterium]|nr:hypothetical protein [Candidatus Eremiobacteraeota bacterium]